MILNQTFTLSNGVQIPKLGLGTWLIPDNEAAAAVKASIDLGYKHIDTAQVLHNADIAAVAKRYGVTIPQLCIQYTLQLGTVSLPKSSNPDHIKSNVQLDFTISDEDMALLAGIGQDYGDDSWWPVFSKKKQV